MYIQLFSRYLCVSTSIICNTLWNLWNVCDLWRIYPFLNTDHLRAEKKAIYHMYTLKFFKTKRRKVLIFTVFIVRTNVVIGYSEIITVNLIKSRTQTLISLNILKIGAVRLVAIDVRRNCCRICISLNIYDGPLNGFKRSFV